MSTLQTMFVILLMFFLAVPLYSQDITAYDIIERATAVLHQESMYAQVKLTMTTSSGKARELFYNSWSNNRGEKNLIRYTGPRRIKDQATLMLNNADDIWSYDPRTDRVRKLATHAKKQKMQGSDFAYEDLGSGDSFLNDYTHVRLDDERFEGHDCFVVELTLREEINSNYSRLIIWTDRGSSVIWKVDYYEDDNPDFLLKTLLQRDVEDIDGVHVIHRYRAEGRKKLSYTVSSIGKSITLTTVTTLLGFGSLIPSIYRGYASLGILVCLGIGLCYLTSVFILPSLLHRFMKTE